MFKCLVIKPKYLDFIFKSKYHTNKREVNLKKPREPDFEKKLLLSLTEPYYKKDLRLDSEKCSSIYNSKNEIHPYTEILVNDCKKEINSPFVFIYHLGPLSKYYFNNLRKELQSKDIFLRNYTPEVIELALNNTKYSCLIDIIIHHGVFSFSEYNCFEYLKTFLKNRNRMYLLGGIIENKILTLEEIEEYTKYEDVNNVRSELHNILNKPAESIKSTLDHHTQKLSFNLENLLKKS